MHRMMRAGDDLKSQRESIVSQLNEKIQALNIDATLVFDAQYHYGEGTRSHLKSLEICFTDQGETADDYIIKRIRSSSKPRSETVVTSDNKLAWRVRRHLANTMSVNAFMTFLNKKYRERKSKKEQSGDEQIKRQLSKFSIITTEHAKKEVPKPAPGKTTQESFEYYLYHFEMRFREIAAQEPPKKIEPPKKKKLRKQTKPPKSEQPTESEIERWRRIFEEGISEQQDDNAMF